MLAQWARERPELDTAGMGIVLRIQLHAGVLSNRLKQILAPAGLAPWEFQVLSALLRSGPEGGLTATELCESAQLTSGAMTHRLDRLEERSLLRRRTRKTDRRSIVVTLTPKGRTLVAKVMERRMADATGCVSGLSRTEQRTLTKLLRALSIDPAE